jgi:FAD/FMN-containing dehydrogenase
MVKTTKNKIVYEENINNLKGKALAIVFPDSIQELKNLIKISEEDIVFRGSGTSFTGGVIPRNSVIVDFSKMDKILEINPSKKTVIVEPGVLLSDLNEELDSYGLEFPIIPLFEGIETIGGMIAKNSAGNREIKYNRTLNWVDSLEVVDGKGEQIKVSKSDLSDFVGMEGITGAIIKATLRVTNKKSRSMTILKAKTLEDVFITNRKLRLKQDISSIDLLSKEISLFLGLEDKYHIFVETENEEGTFKGDSYLQFIKLKNKAYKKASGEGFIYMSNVKFLIDSLQDFLIYLEEKKIPYFSHLASGTVYPLFRTEQIEKMAEAMKLAKRLRGKIAYNFGIGLTKKDMFEPGESDLIKRVKNRHDPNWKLNQDKVLDFKLRNKISEKKIDEPKQETPNIKEEPKQEMQEAKKEPKQDASLIMTNSETTTIKRPEPESTPEEREKIRKIASGFFGGGKN